MIKKLETGKKVLQTIKATNIEPYTLVSNYGLTFSIGDHNYDVRYWANCYGVERNIWECSSFTKTDVDASIKILIDYLFNTSDLDD